jgi:hypothetical protein
MTSHFRLSLIATLLIGAATVVGCQGGATIGNAPPGGTSGGTQSSPPSSTTSAPPFATASPTSAGATPSPVASPTNLAKIACLGAAPYVSGTAPNFTQVGPGAVYVLVPEDANGNPITAALSFTPSNATQGSTTAGASQNTFLASVSVVGTGVPFIATGSNANGTKVAQTCTITRVEALYVANRATNAGQNGTQLPSSVTVYPASASGNATPTATLAGTTAATIETEFVAVDNNGYIFATNQGPMPGATYSPTTSGYVSIYAPNSNGNAAPVAYIPNLGRPEGIWFDAKGNLYVMQIDRITEYAPNANGLGGPAVPYNTIMGSNTGLDVCYGLELDTSANIYTACTNTAVAGDYIATFPAGSTGNATPTEIEPVGNTSMTYVSDSWLGVGVDTSGNILAVASNQNLNDIDEYAAGSSGTAVPTIVKSTSFSQPIDIVIDPSANYFVSNLGNNSVLTFAGATTFTAGLATTTLSGANTGLNEPFGIFVK